LDSAALIGAGAARYLQPDTPLSATTIYVRVIESAVVDTRAVLGRTANPANPSEVLVSRPSDALRARTAADQSYTTLSLGLGVVGLLVGGIGIANVMVIAVLERRREIGVRRSLGATRGSIRSQFLLESVLLGLLGGVCGAGFGAGATVVFSLVQGWSAQVPWVAMGLGAGASVVIGALAGWYPAARAARVPPTEALRTA
jgi:putative ABC transport system permease protein